MLTNSAIILRYSDYSNSQSVTVNAVTSITNNTICCSPTIAPNTAPARINGFTPSGGNGNYAYQWQQSTDEVHWSNVSDAINKNYQPPSLSQIVCYRRGVNSGGLSNTSVMVIIHVTTPGIGNNTICCSQTIQPGIRPALMNGSFPTGGNGTYVYQWQRRVNGRSWTDMGGATNRNMQPPVLHETTRRRVTSGGALASYSNTVTIITNGQHYRPSWIKAG